MRARYFPTHYKAKCCWTCSSMAGLTGPDQELPATVRVKHGTNRDGKTIHYFMNYSSAPQAFNYAYRPAEDLLAQSGVATSQRITLKPWDLVIIEEK